jgi:DNA-binding response OmpR family regulator
MARVLVIEDDPLILRMLERTLAGAGHTIVTALDGEQARQALAAEPPVDLVVTDIDLPEIDGLQIIGALRRDGNRVPILALSARIGRESRLPMATAFGADRTLVKPFDLRQLLDAVEQLLPR